MNDLSQFSMVKWLQDFIGSAPHQLLMEYKQQRAASFVEALRRPFTKVPDDVLLNEYNKGRADEAEVDIFFDLLENYQAFRKGNLDNQEGATK